MLERSQFLQGVSFLVLKDFCPEASNGPSLGAVRMLGEIKTRDEEAEACRLRKSPRASLERSQRLEERCGCRLSRGTRSPCTYASPVSTCLPHLLTPKITAQMPSIVPLRALLSVHCHAGLPACHTRQHVIAGLSPVSPEAHDAICRQKILRTTCYLWAGLRWAPGACKPEMSPTCRSGLKVSLAFLTQLSETSPTFRWQHALWQDVQVGSSVCALPLKEFDTFLYSTVDAAGERARGQAGMGTVICTDHVPSFVCGQGGPE